MLVSTRNHARDWSLLLARLLQHLMIRASLPRVPIHVARTLGPNEDTTSSCSMSSAQGNSCIVGTSGDPRRVKDRNRNFGLPRNGISQLSFQSDTSCGASSTLNVERSWCSNNYSDLIFHIDRLLNLIWDDLDPPKKGQNVVTLSLASSQPLLNPSLPCGLAIVIS